MSFLRSIPKHLPPHSIVLLRVDFNVPLNNRGEIIDSTRILNHLPTIRFLKRFDCKIVLISHFGKPNGRHHPELSFSPLLTELESLLQEKIDLQSLENFTAQQQITLLDNVRFYSGEESNDDEFSQKLASLGTIYVNDAFSVSHRAHASTVGVTHYLPSYAGLALQKEFNALFSVLHNPKPPTTLLIGGKKLTDKIGVLEHLLPKVDQVLIGGACANAFYQAQGKDIGKSYFEVNMVSTCAQLLQQYGNKIILPKDFAQKDNSNLDIGPKTIKHYQKLLANSHSVIWAGPMGKYEETPFNQGTTALLTAIIKPGIMSVVGGGDTIAALKNEVGLNQVTLISLGGGAMLEFLAKEHLPGTDCLLG